MLGKDADIGLEDSVLFGNKEEAEKFEEFQQKVGKMMYQEDEILMEKWMNEERERRIKDEGKKPLYESTK